MVTPASAAGGGGEDGDTTPVLGGFVLGDGLEASLEDRDGSFHFASSVGGVTITWDSRAAASDAFGLGPAWGFGVTRIVTDGGIEVGLPNGNRFRPDDTHPSGLAGYGIEDAVFSQSEGTLPARNTDPGLGLPGSTELPYAFTLTELGGTVTFYSAAGDPLTQISPVGARSDWVWDALVPHRLVGLINPDGMVTSLDWSSQPGAVLVTAGANLPGETDPVTGEVGAVPVSRIELDGGRVSSLVDAAGGRTTIDYDDSTALIAAVSTPSGATTSVAWRTFDDGTVRAERVRTTDATGRELSSRAWAPAGDGALSSGWPTYGGEDDLFWSGDPSVRYSTSVTDGATRVVSEYNALHVLLQRQTIATTGSGERVIESQAIGYPDMLDGGLPDPAALPGNWARPVTTELTRIGAKGAVRSTAQAHEYDRFGRSVAQTSHDGTVTTTVYDDVVPAGAALPIGLPVLQITTAPDGQISTVRYTLDDTRTAVLATEVFQGRRDPATDPADGDPTAGLVRTSYAEFEVGEQGFVTAERSFPGGDPAADPTVIRRDRVVDLGAGTMTVTESTGTRSEAVATTSSVRSLRHGGTIATTDALGNVARIGHDGTGHPVVAVSASGTIATIAVETEQRDGRNATTTTAPDGVATTETRDALGRTTQITDNIRDGRVDPGHTRIIETRAYPELGTTVSTDAWGATTTARQDIFGRPVETVTPTGLFQVIEYDDVANTITTGLTPTGDLADAERISVETKDESGRTISIGGDRRDGQAVPEQRARYDGVGRVVSTDDDAMTTEVEYDAFGNPATTIFRPHADAAGPRSMEPVTASRRFDGFGTSLEKTLSTDREARSGTARTVDELGRTTIEADQLGRESTFEYTVDGLVSKMTAGSGQVIDRTYDPVTRALIEQTETSPGAATVRRAFEYDPATGAPVAVFDPEDRVGTEIRTAYDAHGNPLTVTYPDGARIRHRYDEHGRRTTETTPEGVVIQTGYWADGRRKHRARTDPATLVTDTTEFYWDGATLLNDTHTATGPRTDEPADDGAAPTDPAQVGTASYLIGAARHARSALDANDLVTTGYLGTDRHRNVTEVTDEHGRPIERRTYGDYGVPAVAPVGDRTPAERGLLRIAFGFAGEYTDETGTQHLGARDYDADSMRFITMDTADLHNLYAFADLNPITNIDPSGRNAILDHENWMVIGLGIAGLLGAALTLAMLPAVPIAAAAAGTVGAKMIAAIKIVQVGTVLTMIGDSIGVAGAAAKEVGLTNADLNLDPEFPLAEIMEYASIGAGFAGFGIASGAGAAIELGRRTITAVRAAYSLDVRTTLVERELQNLAKDLRASADGMTDAQRLAHKLHLGDLEEKLVAGEKQLNRVEGWPGFITDTRSDGYKVYTMERYIGDVLGEIEAARAAGAAVKTAAKNGKLSTKAKQTVTAPFAAVQERYIKTRYPYLHAELENQLALETAHGYRGWSSKPIQQREVDPLTVGGKVLIGND